MNFSAPGGCGTATNTVLNIGVDLPVPSGSSSIQIHQIAYAGSSTSFSQPSAFVVNTGTMSATMNPQSSAKMCCTANNCDLALYAYGSWYENPSCGTPPGCSAPIQWYMLDFSDTMLGSCNDCGIPVGAGATLALDISFGGGILQVADFGNGTSVYISYDAVPASPSVTPTPTETETMTSSQTLTPSPSPTPTETETMTPSQTLTPTPSETPTETETITPSKTLSITPTLSPSATPPSNNLVPNGDFELGWTGFTTSYTKGAINNGPSLANIYTGPINIWGQCNAPDHTKGNGKFLGENGASNPNDIAWQVNGLLPVVAGSTYRFQAWVISLTTVSPSSPGPILKFYVSVQGGPWEFLGTHPSIPNGCPPWAYIHSDYIPSKNGTFQVKLVNTQTSFGGNDYALDDIYFGLLSNAPYISSSSIMTRTPSSRATVLSIPSVLSSITPRAIPSSRESPVSIATRAQIFSESSSASSSASPRESPVSIANSGQIFSESSSASSSASSRESPAPLATNKQLVSETSSASSSASSKKSAAPLATKRQVFSKTSSAFSRESPLSVASNGPLISETSSVSATPKQSAHSYESYSSTSRITGLPRSTSVPTLSKYPKTRPTYTSTGSKESYMIESASGFASRMEIPTSSSQSSYYPAFTFTTTPKNSSAFLQTTNYSEEMSFNAVNLLNTFANSTFAYSSSDSATQTNTILSGTAIGVCGAVMLAAAYRYFNRKGSASASAKKEAEASGPDSEKGEAGGFAPGTAGVQSPPTLFSYGMSFIKSPSKLLNLVKNPKQAFSELQKVTMETIAPVNKDLTKVTVVQETPKKIAAACPVCAKKLIEQKKAAAQKKLSVKPKPGSVEKRKPVEPETPVEPEIKVKANAKAPVSSAASVLSEDRPDSILNASVYRDLDDDDIKGNDVGDSVSEQDISLELPNTVHEAEEEGQVQGSTALVEIQKEDMEQVLAYLQEMKKRHTVIE